MKIKIKEVRDSSTGGANELSCSVCVLKNQKACNNFKCHLDTHFELAEEYEFEEIKDE